MSPDPVRLAKVSQVVTLTLESKPLEHPTNGETESDDCLSLAIPFPTAPLGVKLSNDPLLVEKVRDGLYLNPPERALVLCVDEANSSPRWRPPTDSVPQS